MSDNIKERAIVPFNPASNTVLNKDKYHLFAPVADINKVGMAGFNPDDFNVNENGIVSFSNKFREDINNAINIAQSVRDDADAGLFDGEIGPKPAHEWSGTSLRFENPDGTFGMFVNLKGETGDIGPQGPKGDAGQSIVVIAVLDSVEELPAFSMTRSGDAYIVIDQDGKYDLYIHTDSGTDWDVIDDWGGVPGPQGIQGPPGEQGEQGQKGDPSTLDYIGVASTEIDLSNRHTGVYGTIDNPLIIDSNAEITFTGLDLPESYQKTFKIYIKRTEDVSVTWDNIAAWANNAIPLLPLNMVCEIFVETSNGTNYYGKEGDYWDVQE
jgi:hypothetical protein